MRPARPRRAPLKATALVLVLLVLSATGLVGAPASAAGGCETSALSDGDWTSIPVGPWPSGGPELVDYAPDIVDPDHLLATNGSSVVFSRDGGCSWAASLDLTAPDTDRLSVSAQVVSFTYFADDNAVLLVDDQLPLHHPAVLFTQDGGATWENFAAEGLAQVRGRPLSLAAGGGRLYLLIDPSEGKQGVASVSPPHRLYVSEDGGQTWNPTEEEPPGTGVNIGPLPTINLDGESKGSLDQLEANPTQADDLWLYGSAGLYQSRDGGKTATPVHTAAKAPISETESTVFGGSTDSILSVYSGAGPTLARSVNGGPFLTIRTPSPVESSDFPAVSGPGGVFVEDIPWETGSIDLFRYRLSNPVYKDISASDHRQITDVETVWVGNPYTIFGRTSTTIERYDTLPPDAATFDKPIYIPEIHNFDVANLKGPRLFTPLHKIVLHPGQSRTVRYTLGLPPTPTPLDVFFLIDTSSSMQDAINGTRAAMFDIIQNLKGAGIDVWFGVGQYRSYTSDPAYDRVLDMAPPGPALSRALNSLEASQGGFETQLAALYQVATGEGQDDHTPSENAYIKPGQQANFRRGSLRVIVHATDEEFSTGRPHPTYEKVEGALNAKSIKQVGIDLYTASPAIVVVGPNGASAGTATDAGPGLRKVAAATNTLAPPDGVDCDGDGVADLSYEQPIVCKIAHDRAEESGVMGSAIVNTLQSLKDVGLVQLGVAGDPKVSAVVKPPAPISMDFKQKQIQGYEVTYKCDHLEETHVASLTVSATRAAGTLADTDMTVICKVPGDPVPHSPAEKKPVPVVQFFAPLVPLVPIPPRPPDIASNPNPQPNPNPQAQAQGQGAFAAQEEHQPQLAYAHNTEAQPQPAKADEESGDRFAFTRYRQPPSQRSLDPVFILAVAAMTCAAGAALVRQRTQSRVSHARVDHRTRRNRRSYGRGY